ncbi:unnamed protein product [Echinostoma caproni]|uniref:HCO3_cotransp domain-containing protein n=1 Tax=Echinostoma caproni TaxID=27848 RepID=A0A183B5D7_9TREM|nr:unnamed protein product [Echinostoma caproni]
MQNSTRFPNRPRRGSKVSEILDRFTRIGTTERTDAVQPTSTDTRPNGAAEDRTVTSSPSELNPQQLGSNRNFKSYSINEEDGDPEDGCLFSSREGHRRSFGQAWSWFKERRRLTSIGLNASLTFLSIPAAGILLDILESKREPILNIAD